MSKKNNYIHIKEKDSMYYLYSESIDLKNCEINLDNNTININLINLSSDKILITSDLRLPHLVLKLLNCKVDKLSFRSDVESLKITGDIKKLYIGAQGLVYSKIDLITINLEELYFDLVHIGKLIINTKSDKLLIECFMSDIVEINTNQKNLKILTSERGNKIKCKQKYELKYFDIG